MYVILVIAFDTVENEWVDLEIEIVAFIYSIIYLLAVVIYLRILLGH